MKARIVISLALIGPLSLSSAYAMTNTQAKQLATAAYNGSTADLANLKTAAKGGNAAAQLGLGEYYSLEKHYTKAVYWWNKAAAQGDTKADYDLGAAQVKVVAELLQGNFYFKGIGVPQNYGKAVYSWKKAADQGNAIAENNLGNAYYYGQGVSQNYAKANYWYEKAAAQGNARGEKNLGYAYYNGQGVSQNYAKANYWWEKAADQGDVMAEYYLGVAYYFARGVPQDYAKANYWYEKAAAQGYAKAEYNLGNAYYFARGVPQDYTKADYWYEKAAAQGNAGAELNLGSACYHGRGVPQDTMTAITLWKKAAAQGGGMGRLAQHDIKVVESSDLTHTKTVKRTTTHSALVRQEEATNSGPDTGRFTTDCDNMSCVRHYSNGAVIHFTACMNPADMEPMDGAPVVDGQGACSGTDAEGNFYGMGSFN